jgi:hypothetical protein
MFRPNGLPRDAYQLASEKLGIRTPRHSGQFPVSSEPRGECCLAILERKIGLIGTEKAGEKDQLRHTSEWATC